MNVKTEKKTKSPVILVILGIALLLCCACGVFSVISRSTPEAKATATAKALEVAARLPESSPTPDPTSTIERTQPQATEIPAPTHTPTQTPTQIPKPTTNPTSTQTPTSTPSPMPTNTLPPTPPLPTYTMYEDSSYEDAGTFKVLWEIIVSTDVTEETLTALLQALYEKAAKKAAHVQDRPVVIDIKAYTSEEHASSIVAQWIGWMTKDGNHDQPSLFLDKGQLEDLAQPPDIKFGLTEEERIRVFQDIVRAEDRAHAEAEQRYPGMLPYDKYETLYNELTLKYKTELATREDLSLEDLDLIAREGIVKNWPFPP